MRFDNSLEVFLLKWSFGFVLLSIPVLFVIKLGLLTGTYLKYKWVEFMAWVHDPALLHNIGHAVWEAIKGGVS